MKSFKLFAVMLLGLGLTGCGFEIVDTGHRGVKTTFGEVVSEPLPEGIYFYNPMTSDIVELDTRVLRWDDATDTYTKDVQQTHVSFTLNYALEPGATATIYKEVGVDWSNKLVPQVVHDTLKQVVGTWDAVDLVSHRDKAKAACLSSIREQLAAKNVKVTGFEITGLAFSKDFTEAVETKVVAIQNAIAEQNRSKQIEEKARQAVMTAKAEAESISLRSKALENNPKLVEWEAVQKWNGVLPVNVYGSAPLPFINIK